LQGVNPESQVFCIEGVDWKKVTKVDPRALQRAEFAPGEMKLYLVVPRLASAPEFFDVPVTYNDNALDAAAFLREARTPVPLTLTVLGPDGKELYRVYRASSQAGLCNQSFPIGSNAPAGSYLVRAESPVGGLKAQAVLDLKPQAAKPSVVAGPVRVFDAEAIGKFLTGKPEVVIAAANENQREIARKLAADLSERGVKASVKPESEILHKVRYPRVWNPYARLYTAAGAEKAPPNGTVKMEIQLGVDRDGKLTARTADGKDVSADWRQPNSLVTVVGEGFLDYSGDHELCFEPGVKLAFDDKRQMSVVRDEVKDVRTTEEFRSRWAKPWSRLTTHVGAYQLPPQLPEAYAADSHLILLGDGSTGTAVAALQASELLPQVVDKKYPGPGKALVMFAWSPFAVEKNVILVGASDAEG